jgi:tetratricopeptide (TPR) repeat protein
MKLGQIYYRTGDFAGAQNQFEMLARDFPTSPLVESALFMAGQAAMQTMSTDSMNRALELFEQTIKLNGPLKLYARQQQAIVQMRIGKFTEAIALYDDILNASPVPDRGLQSAAMLSKGDALFALGATDPKHFAEAQQVFAQLAAQPDIGAEVRNEANYKKAKCSEKLGKTDEAVAAFYDVVQAQLASTSDTPEYFWSYKAGFEAGQLLEDQQQWKSAIGIYSMLTDLAGPRSEEAKKRANDIRLEHFVWDN